MALLYKYDLLDLSFIVYFEKWDPYSKGSNSLLVGTYQQFRKNILPHF